MVQLIPGIDNPTRSDIDAYITHELLDAYNPNCPGAAYMLYHTVREIHSKSGVGALLHPADDYFIEQVSLRSS